MQSRRYEGRIALVTGGTQGIGRAIVERLLLEGAKVGVVDVDVEAGRELESAVDGERLVFIGGDVADEGDVEAAVKQVARSWGGLDLVVNNAGVANPVQGPLVDLRRSEWERMLAVDLTGPMLCAKHSLPWLKPRRGSIINIASTRALQSEPHCEGYAASKGGLLALTHALAISWGPQVRVNAISPGWIETSAWKKEAQRRPAKLRSIDQSQHPVGRVGRPQDVAGLAAWLGSEEAGFVTGQNFVVDGGMTRKMIYAQ